MLNTKQSIVDGDNNIQAARDVIISNYFTNYVPAQIVFHEGDLCQVIDTFKNYTDSYDDETQVVGNELEIVLKPEKNRINKLSEDYFENICDNFLPFFKKVDTFLKAPQNKKITEKYRSIAFQLNNHIAVIRKNYEYFEEVLNKIICDIKDTLDKQGKSIAVDVLIVFINYMYWNCDIGRRV